MNRHLRYILFGFVWLLALIVTVLFAPSSSDFGQAVFVGQTIFVVWAIVAWLAYYAWLRGDAAEYGRPHVSAVLFALLVPFLNVLGHFIYLFYSRGARDGLLACLKFLVALLALGVMLHLLQKLTHWSLLHGEVKQSTGWSSRGTKTILKSVFAPLQ